MSKSVDMTAFRGGVEPNSDAPHSLKERIEFNEDFKLDWHDPDEATDGYQLKWIGKDYARLQSGMQTETVIIPDTKHNKKEENKNSENLFFTGDNLEVLRHLQNAYSNSIKMIYIDPPYNTGSEDFVYNDKFEYTDEQLKDMLGITDEEIKRLHTINGKSSHSAWLTFMYPRLKIARKLLTDDGVIFISIDDNEQANLKLLCDEIFGEGNFITNIIWQKKFSPQNDATYFSQMHDFIICCAKRKKNDKADKGWNRILLKRDTMPEGYKNPDNDPKGFWSSGDYTAEGPTPNCIYEIIAPNGKVWLPPEGKRWVYNKENYEKLSAEKRFWFGRDGNAFPRIKRYWSEVQQGMVPNSIWTFNEVGHTQEGKQETNALFGRAVFDYPKPVRLLKRILELSTIYHCDDIILDFFAGSASTAHAVMQLNAEDGGTRKFIMVQLPEYTKEDSEARKAGFNTIDEISRKRIELAANKIKGETNADIDYGFKHYYVKNAEAETINKIFEFNPNIQKFIADDMVSEFDNEYSSGKDVILTTWLVSDGYKLNETVEEIDFCGYKAHYINNSFLYLIDNNWNNEQTKDLLNKIGERKININTIIVYGYSFSLESLKELEINIKQNFDNKIQIEKRF